MDLTTFLSDETQLQAIAQLQWGDRSAITGYTLGLPIELQNQLVDTSLTLIHQAMQPQVLKACRALAPNDLLLGNAPAHNEFFTVDFALVAEAGKLQPRLIELQAFPSFYAYALWREQLCEALKPALQSSQLSEPLPLPSALLPLQRRWQQFAALFHKKPHEAGAVIMLDIAPTTQPSGFCFELMAKHFAVIPVALSQLYRRGRQLYFQHSTGEQLVSVIYNRLIIDEPALAIQCRRLFDDAQLRWIGHPDWFYLLGKQLLPMLQHPLVPASRFVDLPGAPIADDEVIKPLFGYGGAQVLLNPTAKQIDALPTARFLAQQRQHYHPCVTLPREPALYCEMRLLCIWPIADAAAQVTALVARTSDNPLINNRFRTHSAAGITIAHGEQHVA